jgi:hypothetical protein
MLKLRDCRRCLPYTLIGTLGRYSSTGNMELFSTHKNRLDIEKDAEMLANRISMLQQEEEKIMKKIQQTRKRAEEILKAKQRNDELFDKRMREREMKIKQEEENRQRYFNERVQHKVNKNQTVKAIKSSKKEEYKHGKALSLQNDEYKRSFVESVRRNNQLKKERVREEEAVRAERLRQLEEEKKKENQEFYYTRVEEERQRILNEEKRIKVC